MTQTEIQDQGPIQAQTAQTGQIENPDLDARLKEKVQEKTQAAAENLSSAQRLTRRAKQETIKIPFTDDLGTFDIEIRIPTSAELDYLTSLQGKLSSAGGTRDPAKIKEATQALYEKMAELCTDPSLDINFWKSGAFLASDFGQIIKEILIEEQRRIASAGSFRSKPVRAGTI